MNTTIQNTTKYKNSPLGLIPEDWEVKKFKEIAKFYSGGTPSTSIREYYDGNIPFIKSGEIYGEITEQFLNEIALKNSSAKMVCKGDILYALYGANSGEVAISKIEGAINQAVLCVRTELNNLFTYNFLINNKDVIVKKYLQGGQGNLSADIVKKLDIPIPPIPEQKAIADCLSTWDKAIEKQNALIAQKELSKKALGHKLLTGKLRIKEFETEKWVEIKADKIFRNNTDKSHNGELEILSASQERGILPRRLNNIDIKYDENSLSSYKKVEVGDYVISLRSFQGGIEYSEYEGIVSPAYTILKEIVPISKVFYKVYFKTETFINRLNTIIYGIRDGKQISFKDFATLKIPYPSIEEQTAIANVLQCADDELQLLKNKLEQLKEQKKGLMQVLLTGKKRLKY